MDTLPITNVVIYGDDDLLPDLSMFEDTQFTVPECYPSVEDPSEARLYALQMARSHFGITLEAARTECEVIVVPMNNPYDDSGRILTRRRIKSDT